MKKAFINHSEAVLVTLALVFLAAVAAALFITVQTVIPQVERTLVTPSPTAIAGFDLAGAAQIDYRGLIATSSTATSSSLPAATSTGTTSKP